MLDGLRWWHGRRIDPEHRRLRPAESHDLGKVQDDDHDGWTRSVLSQCRSICCSPPHRLPSLFFQGELFLTLQVAEASL